MTDLFVTLVKTQYNHALFLRKELALQDLDVYLKMPDAVQDNSEEKIEIQVHAGSIENALHILLNLYGKLEKNPLTEIDFDSIELPKVILVPVDFSAGSEMAGKYAIDIAKMTGNEIKFHNVYFNPEVANSRASATSAFINYQESVQNEEEKKAKKAMAVFSRKMTEYAESKGLEKSNLHFGFSGGKVSDEIERLADNNTTLVILGPKDSSSLDEEKGVVRHLVHKLKLPVLTIPVGEADAMPKLDKALYISEEKNKKQEYLKKIKELFGGLIDLTVTDTENSKIDEKILNETSLVIIDKPKGGIIGSVFGKDFSDKMFKQKKIPALFLE